MSRPPLLTARNLVAGYRPDLPILQGVSVEVRRGEVVTIIGPNGAGKSTLVKAIAGFVQITRGTVGFDDQEIANLPTHQLIAQGLAYVPQRDNVFVSLTVQENLRIGGFAVRRDLEPRIERALALFPALAERRRQKAAVLSGGERQMLAISRALLPEPRLVILDEPTAGLAPKVVGEVLDRIRALASAGIAVLMVEQNAKAALARSDRGYVLAEGRNHTSGSAAELLADPKVRDAFLGGRRSAA